METVKELKNEIKKEIAELSDIAIKIGNKPILQRIEKLKTECKDVLDNINIIIPTSKGKWTQI